MSKNKKSVPSEWITAGQAAEILEVTPRHVWHLANTSQIESMLVDQRTRLYRRASVEAFERRPSGPVPKITEK